jgi:hypothetical protein
MHLADLNTTQWVALTAVLLLTSVTLWAIFDLAKLRQEVQELRAARPQPIPTPTPGPVTDPGRHRHASGARATRRTRND